MNNVAIINVVTDKSTGKIAYGLYNDLKMKGYNVRFCYGRGGTIDDKDCYRIDSKLEILTHVLITRFLGLQGSVLATLRLISFLRRNHVDTIFLLNINGYYLNENLFFSYAARCGIRIIYLMIDEYAFLGRCCYNNGCTRYLVGCGKCPKARSLYPRSYFFDTSRVRFKIKSKWYKRLGEIVFVGPEYVINKAKTSPLMENLELEVLDEAINTDFFYPRDTENLREKLGISRDKIVVVCIAPYPDERKGGQYFVDLANSLKNSSRYTFVHVGVAREKRIETNNYIPIGYITDQEELAEYYSIGDIFLFPSIDDTMPNTCLEALACGTPLLCFNISGMPYLGDERVLTLVEPKRIDKLVEALESLSKKSLNCINICREYAVNRYDQKRYYAKLESLGVR